MDKADKIGKARWRCKRRLTAATEERASVGGLDPGVTIQKSRLVASRETWQRPNHHANPEPNWRPLRVLALNWDLDSALFKVVPSFSPAHYARLEEYLPFPVSLSDRVHCSVLGFRQFHLLFPLSLLSRNCAAEVRQLLWPS